DIIAGLHFGCVFKAHLFNDAAKVGFADPHTLGVLRDLKDFAGNCQAHARLLYSTWNPAKSGQASSRARRTGSSSVTEDEGQLLQVPRNRKRAMPPSRLRSSTLPPWLSMYGRTLSSASEARVARLSGCRP